MSLLIGVQNLSKSFATKLLFADLNFSIESGERIGLIGPNGAGKTTLLKILADKEKADNGTLACQKGLRMGFLEQIPTFPDGVNVHEAILEGLADRQASHDDWELEMKVEQQLSKLALEGATLVSTLSGGWKKRVALARELIREPDLLFLDEPTNHLDVESILWLEEFLAKAPFATLTVTHDRLFLQRISNRILELDRRNPGGLLSVRGSYADYLAVKEETMHAQERREWVLKNSLRRESEWLKRGPKARTTKQQARIQRAGELKEQVEEISERNRSRSVNIDFQKSALPKKLLEVKGISKAYGETLFSNVSLLLSPGSRVGILGANGAGKSTLIRILLKKEEPDAGEVFHSDQLQVSYFEQNRESLDPRVSLAKTLCPHGDHVEYRGEPVHIKGYLDRFLFTPVQMDLPVGRLSGGEQSRLLIARLMLQSANLLVLDEPTNDLDMATLNILQDCLTDFEGAILLVTHDRYFLDQVASKIIAFPPSQSRQTGKLEFFADLAQWEDWFEEEKKSFGLPQGGLPKNNTSTSVPIPLKKIKLGYVEQREFDSLEGKIKEAESKQAAIEKELESPQNATNTTRLMEIMGELEKLKKEIDRMYARWEELEAR